MESYQVIVLAAGITSPMYPLNEMGPKHLLPVANKPILAYILENLEQYSFEEIILVASKKYRSQITEYIKNSYKLLNSLTKIRLYIPEEQLPVVELLPKMKADGILKKNFLMVGGDLISNINLHKVLDFHFLNKANFTTVLIKDPDFEKRKKSPFSDSQSSFHMLFGLEEETNRLITSCPSYELSAGIEFKTSILGRHPRVYFETKLDIVNIIVMDLAVINVLEHYDKKFSDFSFTEDFVPFMISNQYNKHLVDLLKTEENYGDIESYLRLKMGLENEEFRPFAYITKECCIKIDTKSDYLRANLMAISKGSRLTCYKKTVNNADELIIQKPEVEEAKQEDNANKNKGKGKGKGKKKKKKKKAKISNNIISKGTTIGKDSIMQRSLIGKNVVIGDNCKIVNCVLLDECVIYSNCKIQDSLIGIKAVIEEKCILKEVSVRDTTIVDKETRIEKEMLL